MITFYRIRVTENTTAVKTIPIFVFRLDVRLFEYLEDWHRGHFILIK
ncbi:hypothetical protein H1P_4040007 [Hyella patelloides LEGE 07179]|uniref:Uncharacterized protein n=1 Tax=Hyella patelloides LEGE 07179 TaxID=945734 RepID=A0A563VXC6_9CYAN|nr:hypothetical protein H1P_4040007 [Hyella patelloides LEGE 07179]